MAKQNEGPIGLCATPYAIAAAQVLYESGDKKKIKLASTLSPNNLYQDETIADSNILQSAIRRLMSDSAIHLGRGVVSISEPGMITQVTKLPVMPRPEMQAAVQSLAEQYAIFSDDDITVDFAVLDEVVDSDSKKNSVFVTAAKQPLVDVWDEALFTLGGTLHAAEPWVVPILRAQYGVISSLESVASVVIDREGTQINIFQDGVLRVSYSIDIGIPNMRRQITRKAFDMSSDETSTENASIGIPTALIGALRNALKFYQIQYAPAQCKHILLVSEQINPSELASQLAEELNLIVEIFDPRSYWDFDNDSKQAFYELSAIQAVTAIGLALRDEISAFPLQLNLRQWPEIPQPSLRVPLIAAGIAAVVFLGGSLLVSSVLQRQTEIAKIRVQEANIEIATETATVETLKAKRAMNLEAQKALQDDLKAIAREDNVNWSQIIYQISTRMPKQVWLTHLGSKEKEIRIEGYSKEASAVTEYIEQLNQSSSFQYMILSTMEKQPTPGGHDVVKFWIVGRISPNMMLRHL